MTIAESTEPRRELPKGWRWAKLGSLIVEAQSGFASGERSSEGVVQVRMNNVTTQGTFLWKDVTRVPTSQSELERYGLVSGDVLFNNTNSTELVGKSAVFLDMDEPVVYSNHFTRLRSNSEVLDQSYLGLWLILEWNNRTFARICNRWIGQSAVKNDKLLALEIPLPPVQEQRRIAALLSKQMAAVEQARAAAEARLEATRALPAAYLREVFEGEEARGWPKKKLGDISTLLPAHSIATQGEATVQAITTACLTEAGFDPAGIKTARMRADDAEEALVRPGEVLIARSNTPQLVGRVALYTGTPPGIVASDLTIRIWPSSDIDGRFITYYLSSLFLSGYWQEHAGGASGSMKKITRSQLVDIAVPYPALPRQQEIAGLLEGQLAEALRSAEILRSQLRIVESLPAALLRQAFCGEL